MIRDIEGHDDDDDIVIVDNYRQKAQLFRAMNNKASGPLSEKS